ncbi:MAG: hypothetical protein FGM21_00235 [Limnohabitans sp.]|nr:hypothetical protein [Limnohabitans sp.]
MTKNAILTEAQKFSQRLRTAMQDSGYKPSATVLANEFNLRYWGNSITTHAARNWLIGISLPKQDKLRVLSDWLHISPNDLLFGPDHAPTRLPLMEALVPDELNLADHQMVKRYMALSVEHRRVVREMVAALDYMANRGGPPAIAAS